MTLIKSILQDPKELHIRLEAVIDTAIDGIIVIDKRGIMEKVNAAACLLFGYKKDELLGQNVSMLMPSPYREAHNTYIHNYLTTKQAKIIGIGREVTGQTKQGKTFQFRLAVSQVVLNDRIIFTGIVHDLSDIKAAEQKILALNHQLEEKVEQRTLELESVVNQLLKTNSELEHREAQLALSLQKEKELGELKSRFVSMASHEFRTPLSTILSSASLIRKYSKEENQENREKHINKIKSAVSNLTGILDDILSLSKLEEGLVKPKIEAMDFRELCASITDELSGLIKPGQVIKYTTKIDSDTVYSDPKLIKNILFNLLSNAIKYSGKNSTIDIIFDRTNSESLISIRDHGIGIPEDDQKHLFGRFFRAKNVENIQGTGLGLNIVKSYITLLGGTITYISEVGKGTTFTVNLPHHD